MEYEISKTILIHDVQKKTHKNRLISIVIVVVVIVVVVQKMLGKKMGSILGSMLGFNIRFNKLGLSCAKLKLSWRLRFKL